MEGGLVGLVAVNNRAGGHVVNLDARYLLDELQVFELPLMCAGGIGDVATYVWALTMGYAV